MKNKENKKTEAQKQTPIIDGDTRPDKQETVIDKKVSANTKKEKKFTKERGADINTLEDFKDAK
jgi:hypothetical protein